MRGVILVAGLVCSAAASAQVTETVLLSFQGGAKGANPRAGLVPFGIGYVTATDGGGNFNCINNHARVYCGTVSTVSPPDAQHSTWYDSVLYAFDGEREGLIPSGDVVVANTQTLYVATRQSGTDGRQWGNLVELNQQKQGAPWTEQIIHQFGHSSADGENPIGAPYLDSAGNIYLSTYRGTRRGYGGLFEFLPPKAGSSSWTKRVLRGFGESLGYPSSAPIPDGGNGFYMTTTIFFGNNGGAVVHLLPPVTGLTWKAAALHYFRDSIHSLTLPAGGVTFGSQGRLYGSLESAGAHGYGAVYELSPPAGGTGPWTETIIYSLDSKTSGSTPFSPPRMDAAGNLFLVTTDGGPANCGVILELSPPASGQTKWTERTLYSFGPAPDGCGPWGEFTVDQSGNFLMTTYGGGQFGLGALVQLTNTGYVAR